MNSKPIPLQREDEEYQALFLKPLNILMKYFNIKYTYIYFFTSNISIFFFGEQPFSRSVILNSLGHC